ADSSVAHLTWSRDGKTIVTVTHTYDELKEGDDTYFFENSTVQLWNARTGELKRSLGEEKRTRVTTMALSPDGKWLAVAGYQFAEGGKDEVRLFNAETGGLKKTLDFNPPGTDDPPAGALTAVAFSPDGKTLACGGQLLEGTATGNPTRIVKL